MKPLKVFIESLKNKNNKQTINAVINGYNKIFEAIDYQEIYQPNDKIEIINDVYDYDTKNLMIKKGTKGIVGNMVNPETVNVKLNDGRFIYVYVLDLKKIWNKTLQINDPIEASKDIYDQTDFKVLVQRGTKGTVTDINNGDWIKIKWENKQNPIGVHISEICKPGQHKRNI